MSDDQAPDNPRLSAVSFDPGFEALLEQEAPSFGGCGLVDTTQSRIGHVHERGGFAFSRKMKRAEERRQGHRTAAL